jgi:putative Mg2+ transporter-C (MgtC) family protein
MGLFEIILRLGAATLVGVALGLNRDLRGKPTGVRTLGLVGLGSALAVMAVGEGNNADASRVIQGIVTGIGFLGAGVIVRDGVKHHVRGLTTAACVWLTACVGAVCAMGQWRLLAGGVPLMFVILLLGGPFERWIHRHWPGENRPDTE